MRNKWIICLAALLLSPMAAFAVEGFDGPTWYDYRDPSLVIDGRGTLDNPVVISTPGQLAQLSYIVNEGDAWGLRGKVFVLGADINLDKTVDGQRVQWIPIGYKGSSSSYKFYGVFLGTDMAKINEAKEWKPEYSHTISGMYIDWKSPHDQTIRAFGLFGAVCGYVGNLTLKDAEISFHKQQKPAKMRCDIGLLCGEAFFSEYGLADDGSLKVYMPNQISNVAVAGAITADRDEGTGMTLCIGGIVGQMEGQEAEGIAHCTAQVTIRSLEANYAGGICGELVSNADLYDCAAAADISIANVGQANTGGIVGCAGGGNKMEGCTSSGTINGYNTGGICGYMMGYGNSAGGIIACSSTSRLSATNYAGGIIGLMEESAYDRNTLKYCAFGGHIDGTSALAAGGICGHFTSDTDLHVSQSLMAGTLTPSASGLTGAIVGKCSKAVETIANCYYDQLMFNGGVTGSDATHITVKPLSTPDLTSGNPSKFSLFDVDENATVGFRVQDGYYPMVFTKTEWAGRGYPTDDDGRMSTATKLLFDPQTVDRTNTLYQPGAWLCALPAGIRRGDCAWDFVSTVSLTGRHLSYEEPATRRTIEVRTDHTIPSSAILRVKDKTATAVSNGSTLLTIAATASTPDASLYHPKPIGGSKQLQLTITVDQVWDGSIASACSYGTGTAEDPFIIKNGAQLAYAVLHNKAGEHYEQICDITLNENLHSDPSVTNIESNEWFDEDRWPRTTALWKAHYDGMGHFVRGADIAVFSMGLFGDIAANASVFNLGIVDSHAKRFAGLFAGKMDGEITNCIAQGTVCRLVNAADHYMQYDGGICSLVGPTNPNALIEDCISAVYTMSYTFADFTPFVSLSDDNLGTVRNCLTVLPMIHQDENFRNGDITLSGKPYIKDCYWLKGYEEADTGCTLEEICSKLGSRKAWVNNDGYFPTLRTFAETDMAKLLMIPFRTDIDYHYADGASDNYLYGFGRQIMFEPGTATWSCTDTEDFYMEDDAEMGVIVPVRASFNPAEVVPGINMRGLGGLQFLTAALGKFRHHIPMRPSKGSVNPGITFEDANARNACLEAFDTNDDGHLSLSELKAVTNEQTLTAFQTATARQIVTFPEFRFFKNVSTLTSQLNGLAKLEDVRLPYGLQTLGAEAFSGCSSLKEVTIPSKMTAVAPRAFYRSSVDSIFVDPFNANFESRDGVLFARDANAIANEKTVLAAFPNGRSEVVIPGTVSRIANGAVYKVPGVSELYFDTTDFSTVPRLDNGGIETADGQLMNVYVCDATSDSVLLRAYRREPTWASYVSAGRLSRYYPLKIDDAVTTLGPDSTRYYVGTLYIGFATELPATMTPFTVSLADQEGHKAYLLEQNRQVPVQSPVVVLAREPGLYRLHPLGWQVAEWPMWANMLIGTNRHGMPIYQEHSAQGSILTPQNNGNYFYFNYDKQSELPPYHAYITYNTVGKDEATARQSHYDIIYDLEVSASAFADGDFTFSIMHQQSNNNYQATLTNYSGRGGCVVVPSTIDWDDHSQVPVKKLGAGVFSRSNATIYSIDMSTLDNLETVSTDRTHPEAPFSGVDPRTIIYLPEGKAKEADNVVVGDLCKKLLLTDLWDFQPPHDFYAEEATYNRVLSAVKNADGTWSSKAYTVCLPYDAYLVKDVEHSGDTMLYRLVSVTDNYEYVFTNDFNYITAGLPYVVVISKGEFRLDAEDVAVSATPSSTEYINKVYDTFNGGMSGDGKQVGWWRGTFRTIDNEEGSQMHAFGLSGTQWKVIRNDTERYRAGYLPPFRAYFLPLEHKNNHAYTSKFIYTEAGDEPDYEIKDFPAEFFDSDLPDDYSDADGIQPIIHTIDRDGTHRYFDLQGRSLNSRPSKGIYIDNGNKIMK